MKKVIIMFFMISFIISSEKIRVTFFPPDPKKGEFWEKVGTYMQIAADDLEIDLKIVFPDISHRFELEKAIMKELNSKERPNYIVFPYLSGISERIMEKAEEKKVYMFLMNMDIIEKDKEKIGLPGERFKYWIGHIFPDDFHAGYELGKRLVEEARLKLGEKETIYINGLNGTYNAKVSIDREDGLKEAVSEEYNVALNQVVYTYWKYDRGVEVSENLLKRYPDSNVIWAASDLLALAAVNASKSLNIIPGKDIFIGGINWSFTGFEEIKKKNIVASVGGHFLEGVIALVFITDHAHGIDIDNIEFPLKTPMKIMDSNNVDFYEEVLSPKNFEKLDIKKLSKYYNPERTEYNLNLIDFIIDETK